MSEQGIGIFGGTFDPIHNGHLEIAHAIIEHFDLERLLLIPAHRPPHKGRQAISSSYHRYAMAALATADETRLRVSKMELEAPERPYTFETLARLRERLGAEAKFFFVMGADSFAEFHTWRAPERILAESHLIVVTRGGVALDRAAMPEPFKARLIDVGDQSIAALDPTYRQPHSGLIYLTSYVNRDISSTEIRRRARAGKSIAAMVPARVRQYLEKYELYRH